MRFALSKMEPNIAEMIAKKEVYPSRHIDIKNQLVVEYKQYKHYKITFRKNI